jgi:Lipopolysaccharide-assembly
MTCKPYLRLLKILPAFALLLLCNSCGIYSFTGANVDANVKTFQVNYFQNTADVVEPGLDRTFTQRLQNLIQNQTNLSLTNSGGDLLYEGEITEYRVSPMTATANQRAAQNRLTISVMVRFSNKKKEDDDFEKRFSFYYDYDADELLTGSVLNAALEEIFERITQDIFNESLAKW